MCGNCRDSGCLGTDYRREQRIERSTYECGPPPPPCNIYECPPPPPLVVKCCVCHTAERPGRNVWSCLPHTSYSNYFGPTFGDLLVCALNLLPVTLVARLGIGHAKCCPDTPQPPVCVAEPNNRKSKRETKSCFPCSGRGEHNMDSSDDLSLWMRQEYVRVAQELADLKRLTGEDEGDRDRDLLQARNYVLDRLAEMLGKREEIERKLKKKKQKGTS